MAGSDEQIYNGEQQWPDTVKQFCTLYSIHTWGDLQGYDGNAYWLDIPNLPMELVAHCTERQLDTQPYSMRVGQNWLFSDHEGDYIVELLGYSSCQRKITYRIYRGITSK